jgi:hypothetical protein
VNRHTINKVGTSTVLLAALVLLSACTPSKNFLADKKDGAYVAVPSNWNKIPQSELMKYEATDTSNTGALILSEVDYQEAYSLAPHTTSEQVFSDETPPTPIAYLRVRELSADESDAVNYDSMRNIFHPFLTVTNGVATIDSGVSLFSDENNVQKGGRGVSTTFAFASPDSPKQEVYSQSIILSTDRSRLYMLIVKATSKDYDKYKSTIANIMKSFTVTGRN